VEKAAKTLRTQKMPKFRKKPVEVEAIQLCWANWEEIRKFLPSKYFKYATPTDEFCDSCNEEAPYIRMVITTPQGDHIFAEHGDWIIKGVNGEFYPCKPDIFAKTYEAV
jgi:hypothetical protein